MLHIYGTNIHQIREELHLLHAWLDKQEWLDKKGRGFLKRQLKSVERQFESLRSCKSGLNGSKLYFSSSKPITGSQLKNLQHAVMQSHAFHLIGALVVFMRIEKNAKKKHQESYAKPQSIKHLHEIAGKAKSSTKLNAPIATEELTKSDGSIRLICKFDLIAKTQSKVAEWVFLACSPPNQFEFCKPNSSMHVAVSQLPQHIENDFRYWIVFDLKDAFHSIRRGHLLSVANIAPVVCRLLLLTVIDQTLKQAAQPSLPQGLASSSKIMSAIVGHLLRQLDATNLVILSYSDDMLIGARTMDEAKNAIQTLHQACENHSAGPLRFKGGTPKIIDVEQGGIINFLGYAVSLDKLNGKVRCHPNIMAFSKFYGKLTERLCEFHGAGSTEEKLLEEAVKYGEAWRYSFPLWKPNEAGLELFAATLEMIFWEMVGASFQQVMSLKIAHTFSKWNQAAKNGN